MPRPANSQLVAVAYLKTLDNIGNIVATSLPKGASWHETGFVQVGPVVGGVIDPHVPLKRPVLQIDCWAANTNTKFPAWDQATDLAEHIRRGTYDDSKLHKALTLRTGYEQAKVLAASLQSEPRPIYLDPAQSARIQFDIELHWMELS
jgi:hypothetical protein